MTKKPPFPKICHTYLQWWNLAQLHLTKKNQNNIWITWHTPCVLLKSAFSHWKSANFAISKNTNIDGFWFITSTSFNFVEFLKIFLINMVTIFMISAKMVTLGVLKIKVFWNKGYYVIIFVRDATNKILSRNSNHFLDVVLWSKLGNSGPSMRQVIITLVLWGFDKKNGFFEG